MLGNCACDKLPEPEKPLPLAMSLQRPLLTMFDLHQLAKETFKGPFSVFVEQAVKGGSGAERQSVDNWHMIHHFHLPRKEIEERRRGGWTEGKGS